MNINLSAWSISRLYIEVTEKDSVPKNSVYEYKKKDYGKNMYDVAFSSSC